MSTTDAGTDLEAPHLHVSEASDRLDVDPRQTVYVGDRPWDDIEGARHAGMIAVCINHNGASWPENLDPPPAVVTSPDKLEGPAEQRAWP